MIIDSAHFSLKNILVYMVTPVIDYWNRKSKATILQMRKLRHWKGEELAQCHTVTDRVETGIQVVFWIRRRPAQCPVQAEIFLS